MAKKYSIEDITGKGMIFPIQVESGRASLSSGLELIRASIKHVIIWRLGSRYFLGEFGTQLKESIGQPNDEVIADILEYQLNDALVKWDNRYSVSSVSLRRENPSKLLIYIEVRLNQLTSNTQTIQVISENGSIY